MDNNIKWYNRKELYGMLSIIAAGLKTFTTPNTVAYQIAELLQYSIGVLLPLGLKSGYNAGNLPAGLKSVIDSIKINNEKK